MDTAIAPISVIDLRRLHGSRLTPLVIDVRRCPAFDAATHLLSGAIWRNPFEPDTWSHFVPRHVDVVVYCVHGHEISKNPADHLQSLGIRARYLDGGIEAWTNASGSLTLKTTTPLIPSPINQPSVWVTRERPKIDRIACPWLIRRFIDPLAEFVYLPATEVLAYAAQHGAIAYDVPNVTFTHRGEMCSFDALIADFGLQDAALHQLAAIVRGADTGAPELTAQSPGLLAVSLGLSALYQNDHEMLTKGLDVYDALYAWTRHSQAEIHNADLFKPTAKP